MPETDSPPFVLRSECDIHQQNLDRRFDTIDRNIIKNAATNEKILHILQGNGEGGLIWKVNMMLLRNQWVDKGIAVAVSMLSTLLTLYLTGMLHL